MPKFEDVADEIISKTINSIMFIDDELVEPFEQGTENALALSKGVYESFRAHDCTIDFYKFIDLKSWESKAAYTLAGRDMLILDWQLSKEQREYAPTLDIIAEAVKKNNLHFICIYTATESKDFPNIIYKINSFLSPFKDAEIGKDIKEISSLIEGEGYDFKKVFNDERLARLQEMVLYRDKAGAILTEIKKEIHDALGKEVFGKLERYYLGRIREKAYKNVPHFYCAIGIGLNDEVIGDYDSNNTLEIRNHVDKNFLIVNHAIILITNKKEIAPKSLYTKFKDAVIHDSGNFLTLMGLEMRNLFKESSSFIGKDIDSINELAFFHHKDTSVPSEAFYDFLKELWKGQASSFLYDKNNQPRLFDTLDEYKQQKGVAEKMKTFLADAKDYQQHLGKLNYYYNVLITSRKEKDQLRFGDIFRISTAEGKQTDQYLLCITAHCDCLYAKDKINNMFYFVKGSKGNLEMALKDGDTAFNSYITNDNLVEVVNWFDKPFTIFIKPSANDIDSPIEILIGEEKKILKYHSTLKENYAQRIANSAFIYPLHVGIFFADTKTLK